uniref:WH1 domain-containing protein n=1 Tax=Heterorhabditis bacteriophora TaxID=37862 RepID=A0A1I7WL03_HETBA
MRQKRVFRICQNDRHQILYRYDLISHRESHWSTYSASITDIGAKCVKTCFSGITFDTTHRSLTGAPAVHPLPYTVQNAYKTLFSGITFDLLILCQNDRHQILYRYDLISHRESHWSTCSASITVYRLCQNDRHQILYRYDLISHRESHWSTYSAIHYRIPCKMTSKLSLQHLQCIHYRIPCKMRQNVFSGITFDRTHRTENLAMPE